MYKNVYILYDIFILFIYILYDVLSVHLNAPPM
jgi:hypothetical protein